MVQVRNRSGSSGSGDRTGRVLADGLGWFSLGLGIAQIAAPDAFNKQVGAADNSRNRTLVRGIGAREIAHGVGILSGLNPAALWSRVAGDAMDLTLLGRTLDSNKNKKERKKKTELAIVSVAGVTMLDLLASAWRAGTSRPGTEDRVMREKASITVKRPIEEAYLYWHDFGNFPHFMEHLQSVVMVGPRRFRWRSHGPAEIEWEVEITREAVNEFIEWRSVDGSKGEHTGSVRFTPAPGGRGTEVTVELDYGSGALVSALAKVAEGKLGHQLGDDLRRFKQVLETGEVVRSEGSPEGSRTGRMLKQRPAQPLP